MEVGLRSLAAILAGAHLGMGKVLFFCARYVGAKDWPTICPRDLLQCPARRRLIVSVTTSVLDILAVGWVIASMTLP